MTTYRYRAARADGAVVNGMLDAPSVVGASALLAEWGLYPLTLRDLPPGRTTRTVAPRRDLAVVFRSIAALVNAGVPLERALAASAGVARGPVRETLEIARAGLREGRGLSAAFAASPGVVPGVVLGMLRAGERGSQLARALTHVADHLEQEAELVARLRQALAYPIVLAVAGTLSVLVIGTVVIPRFAALLNDFGQQLPLATRVLLTVSGGLAHDWPLLLVPAAGAVGAAVAAMRHPPTRARLDAGLLDLPLIGSLRLALGTARMTRALGGMLQAGMPLPPALEAAREAVGDSALAARLTRVRERVLQGEALTAALESERAVAPSALQLLAVGETSGRLADMATRAGDLAAQEAERALKTALTLLEPALIVAFGALVAFVAAALLQAVYSLRPGGV